MNENKRTNEKETNKKQDMRKTKEQYASEK